MSAEEQTTSERLSEPIEIPLDGRRFEIIMRQYFRVLARLEYEPLAARLLLFVVFLASIEFQRLRDVLAVWSFSAASALIAAYWWSTVSWLRRQQEVLEGLLFRDGGRARALLVEFRHSDWRQSRISTMLKLEPVFWAILIMLSDWIRYLLSFASGR